jgi:hypothetical protein
MQQATAADSQQSLTKDRQALCNILWACGELGLADAYILAETAAAAADWVPDSQARDITQAAKAFAKLQFRDETLMLSLLQRGHQLLQQPTAQQGRQQRTPRTNGPQMATVALKDKDYLVGRLCSAVARLDMQQLAPQALRLVATSGIGQRVTHPANLLCLWLFHSWLLQRQLLGGQGLTGLLTQQQLQRGQWEFSLSPDYV